MDNKEKFKTVARFKKGWSVTTRGGYYYGTKFGADGKPTLSQQCQLVETKQGPKIYCKNWTVLPEEVIRTIIREMHPDGMRHGIEGSITFEFEPSASTGEAVGG